jgi:hypothetical protein
MATKIQVVFDCSDASRVADFWATALGYVIQPPPEGFASWEEFLTAVGVPESEWGTRSAVVDPKGEGPRIFFQQVPEAKAVKNRVHMDLDVTGAPDTPVEEARRRIAAEAVRLKAAGATIVGEKEELGQIWTIMQDPEGNEFCLH